MEKEKNPCFVNEDLQIVKENQHPVALVNILKDYTVEIIFLKPIHFNQNKKDAKLSIKKWQEQRYPGYRHEFPQHSTCELANTFTHPKAVKSCHISLVDNDSQHPSPEYKLDGNSDLQVTTCEEVLENVYGTLHISILEFKRLNPKFHAPNYSLSFAPTNHIW